MSNIEVELRSFIDEKQYKQLSEYLKSNGCLAQNTRQETFYFDGNNDFRIQKGDNYSKFWSKSGKIHDEAREEVEIFFKKDDFESLEKLFLALGHKIEIKWYRKRKEYDVGGFKIFLDYTKGYGYIIEIELHTKPGKEKEALKKIRKKFKELKVEITPRKEFEKKYKYYQENWEKLI